MQALTNIFAFLYVIAIIVFIVTIVKKRKGASIRHYKEVLLTSSSVFLVSFVLTGVFHQPTVDTGGSASSNTSSRAETSSEAISSNVSSKMSSRTVSESIWEDDTSSLETTTSVETSSVASEVVSSDTPSMKEVISSQVSSKQVSSQTAESKNQVVSTAPISSKETTPVSSAPVSETSIPNDPPSSAESLVSSEPPPVLIEKPSTDETTGALSRTTYWTDGGKSYHFSKDCTTLKHSKKINEGTLQDALHAKKEDPCNVCAGGH